MSPSQLTAAQRLLLSFLRDGPQAFGTLLEMWEPRSMDEFAIIASELKSAGLIRWCERCNKIWSEPEMGTIEWCPPCRRELFVKVLADESMEGPVQ